AGSRQALASPPVYARREPSPRPAAGARIRGAPAPPRGARRIEAIPRRPASAGATSTGRRGALFGRRRGPPRHCAGWRPPLRWRGQPDHPHRAGRTIMGTATTATPALGPVLRDEMLDPRGRTAFPVDRGQTVRIVDVDGQQVADFVCFRRPDTSEKLSVHNTALIHGTIRITTGHTLLSDRCNVLMTITSDTCGLHDLLAGSCSEGTNRWRYGVAGTPSCRANF